MAIISDKLNKILSAVFGKDVRRALHDGLYAINKETESTTARQNYLDRKYNEQIKNMTLQDPSSAEIVDMRVAANGKTLKKAGDRLNYFDEQLDTKAKQVDLKILENRMNTFTALPESSTTGDAELIDGRIGANGKAYTNIGTAIREQFNDVKDYIDGCIKSNVIYYKQYVEIQANNESYKDYVETFSSSYFSTKVFGVIINKIENSIVPNACVYIRFLKNETTLSTKVFGVSASNTLVAVDVPSGTEACELRLRCTGATANTGVAKFTGIKVIDGNEIKVKISENADVVTESRVTEMLMKYKNEFNEVFLKWRTPLTFPKELPKLTFNMYYDINNSITHDYDFSIFRKMTAIYIDPIEGNNTNSGFTPSLPWKDLGYAIDKIKASASNEFSIFIVGENPVFNYSQLPSSVVGLSGKTVAIIPYTKGTEILFTNKLTADFNFSHYQNNIYIADCTTVETNISSIFDLSHQDENGVYIPLKKVDSVDSIVEYSWCYSNNKLYVKTSDIDQLVVNCNNRLLNFCIYNKGTLYLENCNFLTTNSNNSNLLVNGDKTGLLVMNNCKCSGGTLLGNIDTGMLRIEDISSYIFNTICAYSKHDGFFYYHHNDTSKIVNLEYYCKGYSMGYGTDDTVNCTTAHDRANMIRIGFEGYDAPSGIVDAIGCKTYCERCDIHDLNNGNHLRGYSVSSNKTKGDAYLWIKDCKTHGKMNDGLKTTKSSTDDTNKVYVFIDNFKNYKNITYSDNTIVDSF